MRLLNKKFGTYNKLNEQTVLERTAELRESGARYRSLTEPASEGYWEQNGNMNFSMQSGSVLDMLGIHVNHLLGEPGPIQSTGWNETEREIVSKNCCLIAFLGFHY